MKTLQILWLNRRNLRTSYIDLRKEHGYSRIGALLDTYDHLNCMNCY